MKVHGNGSVTMAEKGKTRKTCRHWYLRVETDHGRKQKRFSGTYTQAQAELQHFIASLAVPKGETLFRDYADKWLRRRLASGEFAESTRKKDISQVGVLKGEFGGMKLGDIGRGEAIDGLLHIKNERGVGGTYMNSLHVKMKSILEDAVEDGEIAKNPLSKVKAPKRDKPKRQAVETEAVEKLFRALALLPLDAHTMAVRTAVLEGLRRGELMGLVWDDVDTTNGYLHVRRSITDDGDVKEPKTRSGFRKIPLMRQLAELMAQWQGIQEMALSDRGIKQTLETPVFASETGGYMNPQNLDRWWRRNRCEFGLDGITLHELRHTFLTMLASSGAPLNAITPIAGWSNMAMANTYIHEDDRAMREAMEKLSDTLRGIV